MSGAVAHLPQRTLGPFAVSAVGLGCMNAVHPIAAVQTEYSLSTRNPEIAVLNACRDIGAALVAFSPLGRGVSHRRRIGTTPPP